MSEILAEEGYEVEVAADAASARRAAAREEPDLVLLDIWMPDMDGISLLREWNEKQSLRCPVVMLSGHGTVETAVEATRLGAFDFVEKPLSIAKLLRTAERALDAGKRRRQAQRTLIPPLVAPVGKSRLMQRLREQVQQVAGHDASVLLIGEPGTGREAFARYMHSLGTAVRRARSSPSAARASTTRPPRRGCAGPSRRRQGRARVFTNRRAAARCSWARSRTSPRRRSACCSPTSNSAAGSAPARRESQPFDARLVSAAPARARRAGGGLRRDLLAHLEVISIRIPPLREYAEDVPDLLRHYVDRLVDEEGMPFRRFSVAAQNRLRNYPWPGNVRELRNLVQRVLIIGGTEEIGLEEIEQHLVAQQAPDEPLVKQDLLALPLREAREQFERAYLLQQLMLCNGKVGLLAKRVGMERTHLYRKLRSLGVDFRQITED